MNTPERRGFQADHLIWAAAALVVATLVSSTEEASSTRCWTAPVFGSKTSPNLPERPSLLAGDEVP
jgi:hypothetical protein